VSCSVSPGATSIAPPPAVKASGRPVRSVPAAAASTASVPPPENARPPVVPMPMLLAAESLMTVTCIVPPAIEVGPV